MFNCKADVIYSKPLHNHSQSQWTIEEPRRHSTWMKGTDTNAMRPWRSFFPRAVTSQLWLPRSRLHGVSSWYPADRNWNRPNGDSFIPYWVSAFLYPGVLPGSGPEMEVVMWNKHTKLFWSQPACQGLISSLSPLLKWRNSKQKKDASLLCPSSNSGLALGNLKQIMGQEVGTSCLPAKLETIVSIHSLAFWPVRLKILNPLAVGIKHFSYWKRIFCLFVEYTFIGL
jgi:hypothetical protein